VRGKLVNAGAGQPLFKIASLDPLRAFVQVPQSLVAGLKQGLPAEVRVAEQRGRVWSGVVARTASALDAASRTMKVEVRVPNSDHALLPGMYIEIALELEGRQNTFILPGSALSVGKEGVRVALVTPSGRVHWRNVRVERDDGSEVEISEGLGSSDSVIVNPGPDLAEDVLVRH
jgi:RND family efflux transporter MFP subunit